MKLQLLENRTMRVLGCSFIRCKASEANGRGGIFFLNGSRSETPNCWMFENVQFTENSAFLGKNLYFIANNMTSFSPAQIIYTKSPATMELENAFIGEDGEGKMIDLVELYVKNRISPYYVSSSHPKALNWISCGSAEVPCETLQMASIFPFFNKQRSIFIAIDEIVVNTPFSWQRFTVSSVSSELTKKALMRFRAEKDNPHTAMLIGKVSMQLESLNITLNDPEEAMLSTLILCEDCFASFEKVSYDGDLERHWEFSFITAVDSYLHLNSTLISNISTNKHPIILCRGADLFAEKSHFSNCVANKTSFFSMNPSKLEETGEITQSYATKMNSHSKFEEEDDEETESRRSRFLSSSSSSSSRKTRHLLSEIEQSTSSIHITDCTFSDINCVSNSLFFVDSTLPTRFWIDNTIFNYIYSSETGQPAVLSAGSYRMLPNDCSRFHLHSQQQSLSSLNSRSSLVDEETPTAIDINNSTFSSCVGLQSNRGGLISQHFCSPRSSFRTCNSSFGSSGCSGNGLGGGFYLSSTHSPVAYEFISCEFEAMIARKGKNVFICGKDLNSLVKPMCFRMNISLYDSESFSGFDEKHVGSTMAAMLEGSSDSVHDSLISDNIVDLIPLYLNVTRRENVYVSSENSNRNNSPECGTLKMPCGTLDIGFNRASLWTTSIVLVGNTTLTEVVIASDCKVRRENSSVGNAVLPRKIVAGLLEGVLNNFRDLSVDEILFLFEEGCDIVCPSFIFSDGVTLEINKCTFTSTLPAPSKLPFHIVATTNGLLKVFGCTFTSLSTAVSLICMTTMTDSEFASNTFNNVTLDGSALFEDGPNVSRNGLLLTNQHAVFSNINQLQQAQSIFSSSKSSSKLLFEGCSFLSCAQSNRDMDGSLIMLDFSSMDIYTSVFDESGSQKIECGSALSSSSSSSSLSNGKLKSSRSLSQPDVEPNKYCSWQTSLISVTRTKLYIKNTIFKRVCVGALFLSGEATRLDNASFVNNSCDDPASEGIHHNIRCNNEAMLEFIAGGEAEHADNFSSMWIDDSGCQFLMHEDIHAEASMYFVPSLASVTYHLNEENVVFSVKGQNMHPCELSLVLVNTHYEMRSVSIAIDAVSSPDAVTLNVPISMLSDIINNADATTLDHSKPVLRIWNRLFAPPPAPVLTTLPEMIAALSFRGKYKGGKAFQNGLASEENNTHEVLNTQFVTVEAEAPPEDKKKLSQNVIIAISVGSSLAALAFAAFTIIAFRICLKSSKKYNKLSEGSALLSINTNEYSSFSFSNANRMEANSFVMSVPADCQSPHFEED
ncbi:uncharacterized protein MONOS_2846 [Monocercomonoides exilis]|uniref:uncharacterized protein n=1 Tax=Monocercomonoides exilis TaxID=2049356 RepID=UPI00355980FF|nr:hypothetical protein MONOS_2846 [Monocercomonoides exilis]|eukprot:MONOS_2846.1-p1 / transcript=MONOS_2846.1 / gene=MONOS_2846 / organism=Monocercomonoides_exilis_PA203 / gene_product=unspecified product / transcript_product=unspecified product / location=Mono_scaffold00061:139863-143729(+) / protein_length=1289 / sequence_SO=supercontig / SO=protein_coding / is_pseudo=false